MATIMASAKASRYPPPTEGSHVCICSSVVDLGLQEGRYGQKREVHLAFEVTDESNSWVGKDGPHTQPKRVTTTCNVTLSEKAKLREYAEGVIGRRLTDAELRECDLVGLLLGKACLVNVVHVESNGNMYANISSISPLPKSMPAPDPRTEWLSYSPEEHDAETWEKLPKWVQEKIAKRVEAVKLGDAPATTAPAATAAPFDDDIPF